MDERDIEQALETKADEVPQDVFNGLMDAVQIGKTAVRDYLMGHRGQSYASKLIGDARTLLRLAKYYSDGGRV